MRAGKRIDNLEMLMLAATLHKSVVTSGALGESNPLPAAFVMNFQGVRLFHMFRKGLFIYTPYKSQFFTKNKKEKS